MNRQVQIGIAILILGSVAVCLQAEKCLTSSFHRNSSAPAHAFVECKPWEANACCTAKTTNSIHLYQTRELYNHTWHRCGKLSRKCLDYWIDEECFYQCSPYLTKWQHAVNKDAIIRVPICSKTCDGWYEACKSDHVCVENALTGYNFTATGNYCPSNKPCMTYEKMYGSGEALCNKMWGESFLYTKENDGSSNCMNMWFREGGPNPNAAVFRSSANHIVSLLNSATFSLVIILFAIVM